MIPAIPRSMLLFATLGVFQLHARIKAAAGHELILPTGMPNHDNSAPIDISGLMVTGP